MDVVVAAVAVDLEDVVVAIGEDVVVAIGEAVVDVGVSVVVVTVAVEDVVRHVAAEVFQFQVISQPAK